MPNELVLCDLLTVFAAMLSMRMFENLEDSMPNFFVTCDVADSLAQGCVGNRVFVFYCVIIAV
jgi:hypothetical protein